MQIPSKFYPQSAILAAAYRAGFRSLSAAERRLLDLGATGDSIAANSTATGEIGDVNEGATWQKDREINAELIVWLCIGSMKELVDPKGIFISGAKITRSLNLFNANINFAIRFSDCYFTDQIILDYAQVSSFDLGRSRISGLSGTELTAKRSFRLNDGLTSHGEINLRGANIAGDLDFAGATIQNPGETALRLDQAIVGGSLLLQRSGEEKPFRATGGVQLTDGQIAGDFNCSGGIFDNGSQYALIADGAVVKGDVFLSEGFTSIGRVSLIQLQVGQSLGFAGGSFLNPGRVAIDANSCNVKMNVTFGRAGGGGTKIEGVVYLNDAQISQTLYLVDVDLRGVGLNLSGASAAYLADTAAQNWPTLSNLKGFQYGAVIEGPKNAEARFMWLQRQEEFNPESYVQAAKVLLLSGDEEGAHFILEKLERIKARRRSFPFYLSPRTWFQEPIGYGYEPIRAIWIIAFLSFLGWIIYRRSYLAGSIVPTDKEANAQFVKNGTLPPEYVSFSPLIYSIETSLPLVKLGQGDKWQPKPARREELSDRDVINPTMLPVEMEEQKVETKSTRAELFDPIRKSLLSSFRSSNTTGTRASPRLVQWFVWAQILLGWALATLFVAGYSGLVHK